ncbi:MAG: nitronate monooxygenase family protein [Candidatus Omnitrophota bacterium]
MSDKLKPLIIGDLEIKIPIIQGGMGVKVSTAPLASAVANCGGAGVIASVGLGYGAKDHEKDFIGTSREGLQNEIREAKRNTSGAVGVNIMFALSNYEDLVKAAAREGADFIISGAGLPLGLPGLVEGSPIKLIPIVSSARAAEIVLKTWKRRYSRLPDAVVVEGPLAGGHLAFKPEDLRSQQASSLEDIVGDVLKVVKEYSSESGVNIPVIAAGGIFYGKDIAKFIRLGAQGVQMATRFVTTFECSVAQEFKDLYIQAKDEDTVIIDSPVGMPGRAIKNSFIEKVMRGEKVPIRCRYQCLKTCNPKEVSYCIADALCNASIGDLDNAIVFAGKNVSKINKIVSVKELMDELVDEANKALANNSHSD